MIAILFLAWLYSWTKRGLYFLTVLFFSSWSIFVIGWSQ